jgi:hypothetical protein
MAATHKHRAIDRSGPVGSSGCVASVGRRCENMAHGGVRYVDRCACGATRDVNVNVVWSEFGTWR